MVVDILMRLAHHNDWFTKCIGPKDLTHRAYRYSWRSEEVDQDQIATLDIHTVPVQDFLTMDKMVKPSTVGEPMLARNRKVHGVSHGIYNGYAGSEPSGDIDTPIHSLGREAARDGAGEVYASLSHSSRITCQML